jgi:hypothetical protein
VKGKYAAKAINRTAAVDNEVIADMRAKLEESRRENLALRDEVVVLNGKLNRSVTREAAQLAQQEIESLRAEIIEQSALHEEHLEALAFDLFDLYSKHNCAVGPGGDAEKFNAEFAQIFGMSNRYGELIDYMSTLPNREDRTATNRRSRRATSTVKKIRHQRSRLVDRQRNPGAFKRAAPEDGLSYGRVSVFPEELGLPR